MKKTSTISGLVVFFVGIGLLFFTFVVAYLAFADPDKLVHFTNLIPNSGGQYEGLVKALGYIVAIGLLLVMVLVGGKITKLGIDMYGARPSTEYDKKV